MDPGAALAAPVLGRGTPKLAAATVAACLVFAPQPAIAQASGAPTSAEPDAVVLKSGERVTGTIVESIPGDHVSVRTSSGQVSFIAWVFVDTIERGGKVESAQAPAAVSSSPYVTITPTPASAPAPEAAPTPAPPASDRGALVPAQPTSKDSVQVERHVSAKITLASSLVLARSDVPSGFVTEVDVLYRLRLGRRNRLDLGLEGRVLANDVAYHYGMGLPLELVQEIGRHFEMRAVFVPTHTWIDFDSPAFSSTNVWALRLAAEATWVVSSRVSFGLSPLAFNVLSSVNVGVITSYEPHLSFALAF